MEKYTDTLRSTQSQKNLYYICIKILGHKNQDLAVLEL